MEGRGLVELNGDNFSQLVLVVVSNCLNLGAENHLHTHTFPVNLEQLQNSSPTFQVKVTTQISNTRAFFFWKIHIRCSTWAISRIVGKNGQVLMLYLSGTME